MQTTINRARGQAQFAKGYIPLPRTDFDDELWREARARTRYEAWVDLRALARALPTPTLKRGEFQISERDLADRWLWDRFQVRRFLAYLIGRQAIVLIRSASGDEAAVYAVSETPQKPQHAQQMHQHPHAETRVSPESEATTAPPTAPPNTPPPAPPYKEERMYERKKTPPSTLSKTCTGEAPNTKTERERFGEFQSVLLSQRERDQLQARIRDSEEIECLIRDLDNWSQQRPDVFHGYANHYAVLLSWHERDRRKGETRKGGSRAEQRWERRLAAFRS